jgi:hypothetical protein
MNGQLMRKCIVTFTLIAVIVASCSAQKSADENGESPKARALKNRASPPKPADVDKEATLDALLQRKSETDWKNSKAAILEGRVVQVEKEEDGDVHIVLAADKDEHDTSKWIIAEVTPAWRKRKPSMAEAILRRLIQKKVRVTGWLFYEPEEEQGDPRGTRWELHPVTSITVVE